MGQICRSNRRAGANSNPSTNTKPCSIRYNFRPSSSSYAGKYGAGQDRKNALGTRYQEVQGFINHIASASTDTLVKEVMQGKYGNGKTREIVLGGKYKAVQDKINGKGNGAVYYTVQLWRYTFWLATKYGTTYQKIAAA